MAEHSYDRDWKLRTIVTSDLQPGQKLAQAMHAAIEFTQDYPEITSVWHSLSNSVVILEHPDLTSFLEKLTETNINYSCFYEPDLDDKLTAITLEPTEASRKLTASLKLALRNA